MNNTNTTPAKKTVTCECPRCCGKGHIPAFNGVWGGRCFKCAGKGTVEYRRAPKAKPVQPLTEYQVREIETIKTGDLSVMSYARLAELRNFSHWHYPQCPELRTVWFERGEEHFQYHQSIKLEEFYANR